MHKFKDNADREWSLSINGWSLKKLKEKIGFDARDYESIMQAANDPGLLCDVLFVLCEEQAQSSGISDRQFGEAMAGDAIEAAAEAYIQETVDFFPRRQHQTLKMMLAKLTEAQDRAMKLAEEKLQSPQMDQMIARALNESSKKIDEFLAGTTTGSSSGNAQA